MWSPARASTWLKIAANDHGVEADNEDLDDPFLWVAAGKLYYAVEMGIGYNSREEFRNFLTQELEWEEDYVDDVIAELEGH
jgi:hypothetical protein